MRRWHRRRDPPPFSSTERGDGRLVREGAEGGKHFCQENSSELPSIYYIPKGLSVHVGNLLGTRMYNYILISKKYRLYTWYEEIPNDNHQHQYFIPRAHFCYHHLPSNCGGMLNICLLPEKWEDVHSIARPYVYTTNYGTTAHFMKERIKSTQRLQEIFPRFFKNARRLAT